MDIPVGKITRSSATAEHRPQPVRAFRRDLTTALRMAASFMGARAQTSTSSFFLHLKGPTPAIEQTAPVPKSVQTAVAAKISTLPRTSTTLASVKLYGPQRAAIPKWMLSIEPVSDTTSNWSALETQAPREQLSCAWTRSAGYALFWRVLFTTDQLWACGGPSWGSSARRQAPSSSLSSVGPTTLILKMRMNW